MNSVHSKTSDPHRLLLSISDKINLSNLSIYYTWKNIKKLHKNNKFKISNGIWNEEFELPDGSCSASDIQEYFEYILKNNGKKVNNNNNNPSTKKYIKRK